MFERHSDRAREIVVLAQEARSLAAGRLGSSGIDEAWVREFGGAP